MDDSCAVCAEQLEWVAYGPCSHREVCSACVARLRFICDDRRCCLCKTESKIVFVTKALGDYTRIINDFSVFSSDSTEGQVRSFWYHEDTQAYFDDIDHYKMIKAMCRLSCSVCDKMEDRGNNGSKRRGKFKSIEQLKGHLYHQHRLFMCSLCLEGRKIFSCEQKLYTRAQLNRHINTGNSKVDGSESERGGFMGHPRCGFCRSPFYGDNELYSHMSTEHYTCHICQRQYPGQYEYYKDYDDLEIHFRREHFLCEDGACLAKKFVVFPSESELKRHGAIEHGGHMSRSQRNAALRIPTSFRHRRNSEQDYRRGRGQGRGCGQGFHPDSSDDQLSRAIQSNFEIVNADSSVHDLSSGGQDICDHRETSEMDTVTEPFESLASTLSEPSSRYLQALSQGSRKTALEESSFPPLSMAPGSSQQKLKHDSEGLANTATMAARLCRRSNGTVTVLNSPQPRSAISRGSAPSSSSSSAQSGSITNFGHASSSSSPSSSTQSKQVIANETVALSYASFTQARPATAHGLLSSSSPSSSWKSSSISRVNHSASAPNLVETASLDSTISDFPPVSATQNSKFTSNDQSMLNAEDVHNANKTLVERIRAALEFNDSKYAAFKEISAEYRQGVINTAEYLCYTHQFGLSHLVPELGKLCPDARKQRELIETYNVNSLGIIRENGWGKSKSSNIRLKDGNGTNKHKGKSIDDADSSSKDNLADSIISTVRKLQLNNKPSEELEVLSEDGYRASRGRSVASVLDIQAGYSSTNLQLAEPINQNDSKSATGGFNQNLSDSGGSKQRKKTSNFHRGRPSW